MGFLFTEPMGIPFTEDMGDILTEPMGNILVIYKTSIVPQKSDRNQPASRCRRCLKEHFYFWLSNCARIDLDALILLL